MKIDYSDYTNSIKHGSFLNNRLIKGPSKHVGEERKNVYFHNEIHLL